MRKYTRKSILVLVLVLLLLALTVSVASAKGDSYGGTYHTVRYGETLYSIGRYYGVSAHAIARANNLYNPNRIYAGQVLYIPSGGGYYPPDGGHYPPGGGYDGAHHRVRWGETVSSIARMYGSSVWAITRANNLHNPNYIYAGQVLYVPYGRGHWGGDCRPGCDGQWGGKWDCHPGCDGGYDPRPEQPIYHPPVPVPYY
jgi:LysM repeat protein